MKFRQSIGIANSLLIYLPFLAITGIWIISESVGHSMFWLMIPNFILNVIVYGRTVEIVKGSNKSSWGNIIARNVINYFVMIIILGIPIVGLSFFGSNMNYVTQTVSTRIAGALIGCFTVYTPPLIFIEQRAITAIPQGIIFLFHNLRKSILLVLLSLATFVTKMVVSLSIPLLLSQPYNFQIIFGVGFVENLILAYIDILIFAMATIFIMEERKLTNEQQSGIVQVPF